MQAIQIAKVIKNAANVSYPFYVKEVNTWLDTCYSQIAGIVLIGVDGHEKPVCAIRIVLDRKHRVLETTELSYQEWLDELSFEGVHQFWPFDANELEVSNYATS